MFLGAEIQQKVVEFVGARIIDLSIKGTIILLLGFVILRLLKEKPASLKEKVIIFSLLMAFVSLVPLPDFSLVNENVEEAPNIESEARINFDSEPGFFDENVYFFPQGIAGKLEKRT